MVNAESPTSLNGPDERLDIRSRWSIFWLLIVCSLAVVAARLWQVESLSYGERVPFLSANDRSRWCTIRSLGDHDTYAIDVVLNDDDGRSWDTIDKAMHWGRDFKPHFYSSKLTLLPTLLAYPYQAIKSITGWTLKNDTFQVVRWLLLICQVAPLVFFFWAVGRIGDRVAETEWTRVFLMVVAGFGTFITTFAITLNNHIPAVISVAVATYAIILIHRRQEDGWGWFALAGFTSAFAAANELPALSFLVVALFICLLRNTARTLLAFLPAAALVGVAFFATNYMAHNDWRPAYMHRSDGDVLDVVIGQFGTQLDENELPDVIHQSMKRIRPHLTDESLDNPTITAGGWPTEPQIDRRWIVYFDEKSEPLVLAQRSDQELCEIRQWNNWYEYPGSYWLGPNEDQSKIDRGEPSRLAYGFHLTWGHHGVFSLTPVWILSLIGIFPLCVSRRYGLRLIGLAILAISITVIAFYIMRPIEDRNYGGWCCGPRWLFWLAPLWLVSMIPVLDAISKSPIWRAIATLLLILSIGSAFYAWTNPWVHPWIYELVRIG